MLKNTLDNIVRSLPTPHYEEWRGDVGMELPYVIKTKIVAGQDMFMVWKQETIECLLLKR